MKTLLLFFWMFFISSVSAEQQIVGLSAEYAAFLESRQMTLEVLNEMIRAKFPYDEHVEVVNLVTTQESGRIYRVARGEFVKGRQRKIIHEECIAKAQPIFKKFSQEHEAFFRAISLIGARLYLKDVTAAKDEEFQTGLILNSQRILQLQIRIDGNEDCVVPTESELASKMERIALAPPVVKALAQTKGALELLQNLHEPSAELLGLLSDSVK